jgi:excinuclease ABC subunit A
MTMLELRGVRVHNLKGVDAAIPLGRLTVVTGVSGSGKSSLVFDTLHAEAQRRYLQSFSVSSRQFLERFDQPDADWIGDLPPTVAVRAADGWGRAATIADVTDLADLFAELFTREGVAVCSRCGQAVRPHAPADVVRELQTLPPGTRLTISFPDRPGEGESPGQWIDRLREEGWVRLQIGRTVHRLGETKSIDYDGAEALVLIDRVEIGKATDERLLETIEAGFRRGDGRIVAVADQSDRSPFTFRARGELSDADAPDGNQAQLQGPRSEGETSCERETTSGRGELRFDRRWRCPRCDVAVAAPEPHLFDCRHPLGACPTCHGLGVIKGEPCSACRGQRFNDLALSVRWQGRHLADIFNMSIRDLSRFVQNPASRGVSNANPTDRPMQNQITSRLNSLTALNLNLPLGRDLATLASGEAQRLRLHRALASNLVNALYLFDEPSAGLHPYDVDIMLPHLLALRDAGNTVVVIDHHPAVWKIADYVIDLGPGAGDEGGQILYQGPPSLVGRVSNPSEAAREVDSDSSDGLETRPTKSAPRPRKQGELRLAGVNLPPLCDLDIAFPLGVLCVVAGVSGAGKTRLLRDALVPALAHAKQKKGATAPPGVKLVGAHQIDDVILFDQTPLQRSARSNPATALKIFDDIRELFAETTDAKIHNFGPGAFSFNQPGGRCETCEGQGRLAVDMQFLPDVTTTCPECLGRRYRKEILAVKVRGLSIAEVLDLTAREAFRFFRAQRGLEKKLKWLLDVGLDYLRLGQPLETLSTGEMQRLKLAGHLAGSRKPRSLFVLIEPTRGLHPDDVAGLLECFGQLLAAGHSLVIEENNTYVLRRADYLLDLDGGRLVAQGTPSEIAALDTPTGRFLAARSE